MAKYRVVPAFLGGKGNKVFKAFDVIDGDEVKNLDSLIHNGSLVLIESDDVNKEDVAVENKSDESVNTESTESESTTENVTAGLGEVKPLFTCENDKGETVNVFESDDVNKKTVVKLLKDKKIEFNQNDSKDVLFALLLESFK